MVGLGEAWTRGNFSSFFCWHSVYDDYIIRLAWIVLWWQTKGSNQIIMPRLLLMMMKMMMVTMMMMMTIMAMIMVGMTHV